jgi:hypothetical protein
MIINNIIRFIFLILLIGYCILAVRSDAPDVPDVPDTFAPIVKDNTNFYGCDVQNNEYNNTDYLSYIAYNEITANNGTFIGTPNINYGLINVPDNEYPHSDKYDGETIFMP